MGCNSSSNVDVSFLQKTNNKIYHKPLNLVPEQNSSACSVRSIKAAPRTPGAQDVDELIQFVKVVPTQFRVDPEEIENSHFSHQSRVMSLEKLKIRPKKMKTSTLKREKQQVGTKL